jgi:pyridoxamine 5'-phosphate oxidase
MINFNSLSKEAPYQKFKLKYDEALASSQKCIEAICISSYSVSNKEVNSRFVNLKFVDDKNFIFFSNYNSPKSDDFKDHNQITALIYWSNINTQIRIKAIIKKTSREFNKIYFSQRSDDKNALAISSKQSNLIDSYESVVENYNKSLKFDNLKECPEFWGGYSFTPYYFEFWEGHTSRLNKRNVYEKVDGNWDQYNIQP